MDLSNPNPNCGSDFVDYSSSCSWFDGNWEAVSSSSSSSQQQLQVSDYELVGGGGEAYSTSFQVLLREEEAPSSSVQSLEKLVVSSEGRPSTSTTATSTDTNVVGKEVGQRVAFRMKSELEVIDDGYRWRKYGKKSVKNSPNPRNYYKCSVGGCVVKKRVERDREDSSYVITAYDGVHNHDSTTSSLYRNEYDRMHLPPNIHHNSSFYPSQHY